jgi:hypothetical protein
MTQTEMLLDNIQINHYPNPCSEYIIINVQDYVPEFMKFELFNLGSQKIMEQRLRSGSNVVYVNELNSGLYYFIIKERNLVVKTERLVKL